MKDRYCMHVCGGEYEKSVCRLSEEECQSRYENMEEVDFRCNACGKECRPVKRDYGIGPFECHGYRGVDVNWLWVSECCEASLLDGCFIEVGHGYVDTIMGLDD